MNAVETKDLKNQLLLLSKKIESHENFILTVEELIINEKYEDLLLKINNYKRKFIVFEKPKKKKRKVIK